MEVVDQLVRHSSYIRMNDRNQHRVVIDEVTDGDIGVVTIDMGKWKGSHYIVDPDGDERKKYKYRIIDAAKYDTVVSFETHPILQVKYKPLRHWFGDKEDQFALALVVAVGVSILCAYIMGTVIMFSDLAPILKNSIWYQLGYWLTMFATIVGGIGFAISLLSNSVLKNSQTKKDDKIENWLEFLKKSHRNQ